MTKYTITIRFDADRSLTPAEQYRLLANIEAQIEDPVDDNGDGIAVSTLNIESRITWE